MQRGQFRVSHTSANRPRSLVIAYARSRSTWNVLVPQVTTHRDYEFLHLFRALSAFWVLAVHCAIWGNWQWIPLPSAKIAVDVFMIISGFLMVATTQNMALRKPDDRMRFWMRRFFRIAPAYYVTLLILLTAQEPFLRGYEALQELAPGRWPPGGTYDPRRIDIDAANVAMHVTFLFGLHPDYSFSTFLPDWSLSLEMQFYLAFPIIAIFLNSTARLFVAAVALWVVGRFIAWHIPFPEPSLLPFKLNYFLAGIALFHGMNSHGSRKLWLIATALALSFMGPEYGRQIVLAPMILVAMLVLGELESRGEYPAWIRRIVNSRYVRFASDTSYGVYLLHGFWISLSGLTFAANLSNSARGPAMIIFVTVGAYASASVMHRLVEMPGIALGKIVSSRRDRRA